MEKTIDKTKTIIKENEKLIANILHDIKSPLYSIKIGLQNRLDTELNKDIFETTVNIIEYIEKFLINYSFQEGKFDKKISPCDIKQIINKKIDNYKYIFINKNIHIDFYSDEIEYKVDSIEIFLSSIIGNIISNIALHASENENAIIEIYSKKDCVVVDFKNSYNSENKDFSLGLDFCQKLAINANVQMKFTKTKGEVCVNLRIPTIKKLQRKIIGI